jgi:hypothetical protein
MTATTTSEPSDRDVASDRLDDDGAPAWLAKRQPDRGVRLVWAPRDSDSRLAGAWWPRTRDATTEVRALLPAVSERLGGAATRVSLNIDAWNADQPRRLRVGRTLVKLGWFHTLDPATITFSRGGGARLTVVVIPSNWNSSAAGELLHGLSTASPWPDSAGEALHGAPDGEERPAWGK